MKDLGLFYTPTLWPSKYVVGSSSDKFSGIIMQVYDFIGSSINIGNENV